LLVAILLFAGYPPVLFFIMIFLFAEALFENKLKKLVFILFFSILILATQILPSIELVLNSVRKSGLIETDASVWSTHFSYWLSLISPIFLKEEILALFTGVKYFWLRSFWIGFVAFSVAVASFFFEKK